MIRAIVADDERLARRGMALRLEKHTDVKIVAECRDGREAIDAIIDHGADVAFLDIEMPGMNGIEVASRILSFDRQPFVVFVTAYDRYAIEAFEISAVDYLLKPIIDERLATALDRLRSDLAQHKASDQNRKLLDCLRRLTGHEDLDMEQAIQGRLEPESLRFDDSGTRCRIPLTGIDFVEAAGDYMCIRAGDRTYVVRTTLAELSQRLEPAGFLRIHRSVLANARKIREFQPNGHGDAVVRMADGTELKCSRTYRAGVREAMTSLFEHP